MLERRRRPAVSVKMNLPNWLVHRGVDGVPGGAGLVGHDHPLLAQDAVGQAGLAHVGPPDDGHRDAVLFHHRLGKVQVGADGVQQVAGAVAVDRRHGHHFFKAQVVELVHLGGRVADAVALVHRQDHRLAAAAQHVGHLFVRGGHPRADVHHKDDAVGGVDGDLGLLAHMGQDALGGLGLDAAGVHQQQLAALPLAGGEDAVAGDAGGVLDDGQPLAAQFIEQGGLAHIGPAHHCDDGFTHGLFPPFWAFCGGRCAGRCAAGRGLPCRRRRAGSPP